MASSSKIHRVLHELKVETLDPSLGRVLSLDGHLFYSPNCKRDVQLPTFTHGDHFRLNAARNEPALLRQPIWFDPQYIYLAFSPNHVDYSRVPIDCLVDSRWIGSRRTGFQVDPQVVLRWAKLERDIKFAIPVIIGADAVRPRYIVDTALVLGGRVSTLEEVRSRRNSARDWFCQWIAGFSYAVAVNITVENRAFIDPTAVPSWFSSLSDLGWAQYYLSGLGSSVLGDFSPDIQRTGVFLNIVNPVSKQFPVDWFYVFNIPVWYPWGKREMAAAKENPDIQRLGPPSYMLEEFNKPDPPFPSPFFDHGSPQFSMDIHFNEAEGPSSSEAPWVSFFREREARNARLIEFESAIDRQTRLNRTREPGTTNADFFIWKKDNNGVYQRVKNDRTLNESNLEYYSESQRIYDPISNHWDCCSDWGDFEDDGPPILGDPLAFTESSPDSLSTSQTPLMPVAQPSTYDILETEAARILYEYYGFLHPKPLPDPHMYPQAKDISQFLKLIGLDNAEPDFLDSALLPLGMDFITLLSSKESPAPDNWDLTAHRPEAIINSIRFPFLRIIDDNLFLFYFGDKSTVSWVLGVESPADALLICRLDQRLNDYEVGRTLLQRGIPFHTFVAARVVTHIPRGPIFRRPPQKRRKGYEWSREDYDAYVLQRDTLLQIPRVARAALLSGGILWRLATQALTFDTVLQGPTANSTSHRHGYVQVIKGNDMELRDDGLTDEEIEILIGLYFCETGSGNQTSQASWWPQPSTWKSKISHGRWTIFNENFFQERETKILEGTAHPLIASDWGKQLRGSSVSRRISLFNTSTSFSIIKKYSKYKLEL
ncbi:hypothetical protein CVT26_008733 [Gymnopilus dilepis]|uniref:Uncharacterized protein n=1 Tax=Gymnopilus dilepis TaxID=231916 RepID=A0A409X2A6_9AGAR|nr:hypothetical protein CVT26_008733 [Gymnopilus dilepis]